MTTLYVRPSLSDFTDTTGYSLTSGGPSAGVIPSNATDVIFDAKSGPSRAVFGSLSCRSLIMAPGTGPITMSNTSSLLIYGGGGALNGQFGLVRLAYYSDNSGPSFSSSGAQLSCTPGTTFYGLDLLTGSSSSLYWVLNSDLTITGPHGVKISGNNNSGFLEVRACTLTTTCITCTGSNGGYGICYGSGTVNVTGWMGIDSNTSLSSTAGGVSVYACVNAASASTGSQGGVLRVDTLKVSGRTGLPRYIRLPSGSTSDTPTNIVLDVSNGATGDVVQFCDFDLAITGTMDLGRGTRAVFPAGKLTKAGSWNINGAGLTTSVDSSSGLTAFIQTTFASQISASYALFRNISTGGATYPAPAVTIKAVNSTDAGGNTGITFLQVLSRFFSFF